MLWVWRSTAERPSPLSGVQRPQPERADGERAEFALRAHKAFIAVRTLHAYGACACGRGGSDRSALLRACGMSGDACRAHRAGAVRQQGLLRHSQRGPWARDVTKEYSRGTPSLWVQCAGTVGAHRCCGCGVVPPERPSPLRVCSDLSSNALTGSVPSSLSALTKLTLLCVPLHASALARAADVGSDRSALLRACGMSGDACRAHRAGAVRQQGLLRHSQRGPWARDVTKEYSRGTPSLWVQCAGTVGAHRCCGCGVVPPERPSPLRVCSWLNKNELTGSVPSSLSALTKLTELCTPPSCHRRLRVRPRRVGSFGSAPSTRHVGGCMSGASSGGGAAAGLLR